jgi:hypothetical protein
MASSLGGVHRGGITDNLLADNDRIGLQVFGAGTEATVRHNVMRHNGTNGLVVTLEARATIADNLSLAYDFRTDGVIAMMRA